MTEDMQRLVREQRLGFVATVCPDGRPNLSPKGTTIVWDAGHLMFADVASPGTVANLATNPNVELNVVDPIVRKGYRFRGLATVHTSGVSFDAGLRLLHDQGSTLTADKVRSIVVIEVHEAHALISPAYESGATEPEIAGRWLDHYTNLHQRHRHRTDMSSEAEAVLLTGVFGVGKSTVAADIAAILEATNVATAAIDLDWLTWTNASGPTRADEHRMMLTNLAVIARNYRAVGAIYFVLARSISDVAELAGLQATVDMRLRVIELTVPYDTIARRLSADPTEGRRDDLAASAEWVASGTGTGLADISIANDRSVRAVSLDVLAWLDWPTDA
jgi:uncharacterized protein